MIEQELKNNGWKVLSSEPGILYAERIITKKKSCFIEREYASEIGTKEVLRIWTKKEFHPFIYFETNNEIKYFDFLSDEFVNKP